MQIIDGKKISTEILADIQKEVSKLSFRPIFCDILVGKDLVAEQYVQMKAQTAQKVGFLFKEAFLPEKITTEELLRKIEELNTMPDMCGIIVQLPLPSHLDTEIILNSLKPEMDVDCLGKVNTEKFYNNNFEIGYPTALACWRILESLELNLKDKKIVLLGYGKLVGRPLEALLSFHGLKTTVLRSQTEDKDKILAEADIIISAIGKGKYLTAEMIKEGAILIDAGTSEMDSGVVGDVDFESVKEKVSFIAKVPGGVGPITVAILLENVLKVAKNKK